MVKFESLEDIASAYVSATQDETEALFQQGDVLLEAITDGWRVKDVVNHCAGLTRRTTRTVFSRYRVSKVFPPSERDAALDWSIHALCADTEQPRAWLALAGVGYYDEDGKHHDHSYRTLKAAIKATGGEPDANKPVYLLDNVACRLEEIGVNVVVLILNSEYTDELRAHEGQVVNVSLVVKAPALETEAA